MRIESCKGGENGHRLKNKKAESVMFFFFFFSHLTQHSIQNITKQNNRHILNISRSNQKGGREGRTTRTQKSLLYVTFKSHTPQGCVLSPLLFTLLTHDCTPSHNSNLFIKFADDMTVVGLISNRDETNYRSEVSRLAGWCRDNNLSLNVEKTKEIVVDFRRVHTQHAPLTINGATVERASSTKFLGVHITEDLSWTNNTAALAKKAQQRLYFLRKLRRARAPTPIMCTFYRGTIESILTSCITVRYGTCNASCRKSLQWIVRAAEKIVGVSLPSLQDIYRTRLTRKALSIAGDPTHPSHSFFSLLPSGRRLRSLQARTSRLKDSFIHQAVRKLNSLPSLPPPPLLPHATLNSDTTTPPQLPTSPLTNCDPHQSLCAALD